MSFLDKYRRSIPRHPDAKTHVVIPSGSRSLNAELAGVSALRRRPTSHYDGEQSPKLGMWVRWGDRTAILRGLEAGDIATIMVVDEKGENLLEAHCSASELRQAHAAEIPAARIKGLDLDHLRRLGYA